MERRVVLVTGSTSGIGRAVVHELARRGARVVVHGRDESRCRAVADECATLSGEVVPYLVADFTSLAEVRRLAEDARQLASSMGGLHVLVANAGVYLNERSVTVDGYETTFQVNHLAHFLLGGLLLDTLRASAPARIVIVSSGSHQRGHIDFDDLMHERDYDGYYAYADTKLANVLWGYALAARLDPAQVTANSLHPGSIATKLLRAGWGPGGKSPEQGAVTPVYLALSEEVAGVTGKYFVNRRPARSSAESYDVGVRERLWEVSERLVGLALPVGRRAEQR